MIYVVTGVQRSGTSMMMACLQAGGMELYYDKALEGRHKQVSQELGYDINPSGFFEPSQADFRGFNFPTQHDGKVIKALGMGFLGLAVHKPGYQVLIMYRNPKDIKQSAQHKLGGEKYLQDGDKYNLAHYNELMQRYRDLILNRSDVHGLYPVQYEDVVQRQGTSFGYLRAAGWPIDPEKAGKVVDIKHWRFNEHGKTKVPVVPVINSPTGGNKLKELGK